MATMKVKRFSLEEGGFTGKKFGAGQTYFRQGLAATAVGAGVGAIIGKGRGALIGSGIGLITGLITAALTRSCFNRKPQENITTKNLFKEFTSYVDYWEKSNKKGENYLGINTENYDIDDDPSKYDISVKANEDSMVMYIRPLKKEEIKLVNKILDFYCINAKNNDYISEQSKDGGWIVTMKLINYKSAAQLLFDLMDQCKFRINFLVRK